MIEKGFEATATKVEVEAVEKRLERIEERLEKVESAVNTLSANMEAVRSEMRILPTREDLYEEIRKLNFAVELNDLQQRVRRLEQKAGLGREQEGR
jgi:archaellum component FlaC